MIGRTIGVYEIVAKLGEGGMGEVYKARDTRLNRDVALKVLPASLADDPERLARFRREAQVLASLNHPNIATVHGFEESGSLRALVMELVDGPTLADMIGSRLPLSEALPIARQIAEALESAHERGVVHRDLKPANVKVRADGTVKVLDFGLAKALSDDSGSGASDAMNSPTLTARATQLGVILGTAAYMSPEQAKGKPVDRRADIWAFGVVLYEMISGRRGYQAEDISETLAAVLTREVDWTALPADTPPRLSQLLRDCLVRDPKQRLRDIGEARRVIEKVVSGAPDSTLAGHSALQSGAHAASAVAIPAAAPGWQRALPWSIAAIALLGAIGMAMWTMRTPAAPPAVTMRSRLQIKDVAGLVAVSRDGSRIAYSITGGPQGFMLMLRELNQFEAKPIPGADGAYFPVFSPDGQSIAYGTAPTGAGKIMRTPITGGTPVPLGDGYLGWGADWGDDDTIVFGGTKGLMRVSATGGTPTALTTLDAAKHEVLHSRPQFLPGGRQLLFTVSRSGEETPEFAVLDLATGKYRTVAPGGDNGKYAPSGHLTYVTNSTLFALPFDLKTMSADGAAAPVAQSISRNGPPSFADYAFSPTGLLVYSEAASGTTLVWVDRKGAVTLIPGQVPREWSRGRLSPEGHRVANGIQKGKDTDIWIMGLDRGTATRVTFGGQNDLPVWTHDGKSVIFSSISPDGKLGLSSVAADASGPPVVFRPTERRAIPLSVSPDDKTLLYRQLDDKGRSKIFVLPLGPQAAQATPRLLREGDASDTDADFSPDGKWIAFGSTESGTAEVYLMPFPGPGGRIPVSREGGRDPRWSHDGHELFFWPAPPVNVNLQFVTVRTTPTFEVGVPGLLFKGAFGTTWGPAPDGRFLAESNGAADNVTGVQFAFVTNWFDELRQRAPARK